jgi:hypothetical protein
MTCFAHGRIAHFWHWNRAGPKTRRAFASVNPQYSMIQVNNHLLDEYNMIICVGTLPV